MNLYFLNQSNTFEPFMLDENNYIDRFQYVQELMSSGYEFHHAATRRGYCDIDKFYTIPYAGRFGKGLVLVTGAYKPMENYKLTTAMWNTI